MKKKIDIDIVISPVRKIRRSNSSHSTENNVFHKNYQINENVTAKRVHNGHCETTLSECKVPGHYRLFYEHDPEEDGSQWWLHKGPITRAGPGTRKNDTLWCDVCARGRAVGLEQSSAIKTGHESGSREGGERGGKRASGGLMHSNLLVCFQSGMRILEPRFRFFTPLSACGINSQISRDFTPADAVKNEWVYVVPKCREWSFIVAYVVPFWSREISNSAQNAIFRWNSRNCRIVIEDQKLWNRNALLLHIAHFAYILWIQKIPLYAAINY